MNSEEIDQNAEKVARAPRVTLKQIKSKVVDEHFTIYGPLTICILTLENGFRVTGEAAAADERNINVQLGQDLSRDRALGKIWPLEGYLLRERLAREDEVVRSAAAVEATGLPEGKPPRAAETIVWIDGEIREWERARTSGADNLDVERALYSLAALRRVRKHLFGHDGVTTA